MQLQHIRLICWETLQVDFIKSCWHSECDITGAASSFVTKSNSELYEYAHNMLMCINFSDCFYHAG